MIAKLKTDSFSKGKDRTAKTARAMFNLPRFNDTLLILPRKTNVMRDFNSLVTY
jgi:hypothetical protein